MADPLPPVHEDPSIVAGYQLQQDFVPKGAAIRGDTNLTPVAKAQQIVDLWESTNAELSRLWTDLQTRRQARIDQLSATVPVGPNVPADASEADKAVLHQAWRTTYAAARDATFAQREAMLADAERFDDDILHRAALTTAIDGGQPQLVTKWAELHGATGALTELAGLRELHAGRGVMHGHAVLALSPLKRPSEAFDLPNLVAARDAAQRETARLATVQR
jgi:hypothetical protein